MKLNPFAIMAEQFDGTGLVFNPESNAAISLNTTGVYLWNRLKDGATEAEMAVGLLTALCRYQSEDGRWYQVVDKGGKVGNWLENSCSCLYAAGICKAVRKGLMDKEYLEKAKRAYEGVIRSLTWLGDDLQIGHVCIGTGVGDYPFYVARPTSVNDLHGVGAFLILCTELQKTLNAAC